MHREEKERTFSGKSQTFPVFRPEPQSSTFHDPQQKDKSTQSTAKNHIDSIFSKTTKYSEQSE